MNPRAMRRPDVGRNTATWVDESYSKRLQRQAVQYVTFEDATVLETLAAIRRSDLYLSQLSDHWLMAYLYIQPNESFDKRYLVFRPIEASRSRRRDEPQAAIALAHWYSVKKHEHWSTTAPVPGNYNDYQLIAQSGYLLTATDAQRPTIEIDDCVKQQGTDHDHILMQKKEVCESHGYKRERTVGWVFPAPQQRTQALYRCFSESEGSHFAANREDCRQQGKMEVLLGYDLTE
jgi:hypothetical protein